MINKDKLIYDSSTPSDGDSVAAFLRTGGGALTSTNVGGKEGLDVNILNGITIDADGVYHAVNNANPDNIGVIGHVRAASPGDAQQTLRLTGGSPGADDLDPANIHALDVSSFLHGWDGSAWDRVGITDGALNVTALGNVGDDDADAGNPVKVGSRAVSGALTALSATNDRADLLSDLYRRVWVNTAPNVGGSNAAVTVDETVGGVALFASPLAGRRFVEIQNLGNKAIFVGFGTVTTANGTRIAAGATMHQELGPDLDLKAISESGSVNCRVLQLA